MKTNMLSLSIVVAFIAPLVNAAPTSIVDLGNTNVDGSAINPVDDQFRYHLN
jgi:hypothetical protein